MKQRILVGALIVSVLLNVAGFIFFFSFLSLKGQLKSVKRERNQMRQNLAVMAGKQTIDDTLTSSRIRKQSFFSHVDGSEDVYAMVMPAPIYSNSGYTLVVYLHGMGSSYFEPFVFPQEKGLGLEVVDRYPGTVFLSCNYRGKASWGNDDAMSDITQNIRQACQEMPVKKIIMMGTSMGGCTALTYAATAPQDIKEKITGIVSVESAGDLIKLCQLTKHPVIRPSIEAALGKALASDQASFSQKSFIPNIAGLPPGVKVAIVSAKKDKIVPPELQFDIYKALEEKHIQSKLLETDEGHGAPALELYLQGLDFVNPRT